MRHIKSAKNYEMYFSAVISLKMMIFLICKRETARGGCVHELVIKTVKVIALLPKNGKNVYHFLDFLHLKNYVFRYFYKYKQVNVPNLVYFGSPSIASYTDYSTVTINLQI